jgi:DNA-binding CsgD family transcriptional regulator
LPPISEISDGRRSAVQGVPPSAGAAPHYYADEALRQPTPPTYLRGGTYPFGGYASGAAGRPLGEVVAEEFALAGEHGNVDLKALGRKAAEIAEREAIVAMLARTGGSKREAAGRLGISYKAILYKIREFGIGRPRAARKPIVESPLPTEASVLELSGGGLGDSLSDGMPDELDEEFGEEEVSIR